MWKFKSFTEIEIEFASTLYLGLLSDHRNARARVCVCLCVDGLGGQLGRYTNWMLNRPAVENHKCVALAFESSWQWTDENCDFAYPFVCETGLVFHLL